MAETFGMRPSNKQRSRNKSGGNNNHNQRRNVGNIINRVFESAGPDGKVRGTPQQIIDKYQALARDAQVSGDRVAAESFLQHSEHYSRMLGEAQRQLAEQRPERDESPRFDGPRPEGGGRADGGHGQERERERERSGGELEYAASGMATIDPAESDDGQDGLIETPESRAAHTSGPTPAPEAAPANPPASEAETGEAGVNGTEHKAAGEAPKPRRGRPRRPRAPSGEATPATAE
jgi:hypothetical protein